MRTIESRYLSVGLVLPCKHLIDVRYPAHSGPESDRALSPSAARQQTFGSSADGSAASRTSGEMYENKPRRRRQRFFQQTAGAALKSDLFCGRMATLEDVMYILVT